MNRAGVPGRHARFLLLGGRGRTVAIVMVWCRAVVSIWEITDRFSGG